MSIMRCPLGQLCPVQHTPADTKSSHGHASFEGHPHLCSQPLCLVLLPHSSPQVILLRCFLKTLRLLNLSHLGRSSSHLLWGLASLPVILLMCVLTREPLAAPAPFTLLCSGPHGISESMEWPGQLWIYLSSCDTIGLFNNPQGPPPTNSKGNKLCVCE